MFLSFSGWQKYQDCPRAYWHGYIAKTLLKPENRVNMLYGQTVGRLFELFYRDEIWKLRGTEGILLSLVEPTLDKVIQEETAMKRGVVRGVIRWKGEDPAAIYASREALLKDVREAVPRGLAIIRHHQFIDAHAKAEVVLDGVVDGHKLVGRADFIMRRARVGDLLIMDGKGGLHRERYVHSDQLLWYAMLYRFKFGIVPDKLGFIFWRCDPNRSVDWIDFRVSDLDTLQEKVFQTIREIEQLRDEVLVKPSSRCKICSCLSICSEGAHFTSCEVTIPDGVEGDVGI